MALLTVNGSTKSGSTSSLNRRPSSTFYVPYPESGKHEFARSQSENSNGEGDGDFAPKPHPRSKRGRNEPVLVINGHGRTRKKKVVPEIPEKSGIIKSR